MALLSGSFIAHLFRPGCRRIRRRVIIAGLILLGAAPCTAMGSFGRISSMVAAFHALAGGLNDTIMVNSLRAGPSDFCCGLSAIAVPGNHAFFSVCSNIVVPVIVPNSGVICCLRQGGPEALPAASASSHPCRFRFAATLVLLFG